MAVSYSNLYAQESINTSGANSTGSAGSVAYSIGQVVYTTNTGLNGSISQGIQQRFIISVTTGLNEEDINLSVYPNPANSALYLKVKNFGTEEFSYRLIDVSGKEIIATNTVITEISEIETAGLLPNAYFLIVNQRGKSIKSFKVIKI